MRKTPLILFVAGMCWVINLPNRANAQGSLTPPGPPGATMITLNQIEPRIPIATAPYVINAPGSYYLTGDLTVARGDAILIASSGVTLDLNGFTISTTDPGNTGTAITINGSFQNIRILNGNIAGDVHYDSGSATFTGGGFAYGIYYAVSPPTNVRVSGVGVAGCLQDGINLGINLGSGFATVVESCTVYQSGGAGIGADIVANSSASDCGYVGVACNTVNNCFGSSIFGNGIYATGAAGNCYGITAGSGVGDYAIVASTAENCYGTAVNPQGEAVGVSASTVLNCVGSANATGDGVSADLAHNCYGYSEGGCGLFSSGSAENCYGGSNGSNAGLDAPNASNCNGVSGYGYGISATIATGCYGESISGTSGLTATVAASCMAKPGYNVTYKYNMP